MKPSRLIIVCQISLLTLELLSRVSVAMAGIVSASGNAPRRSSAVGVRQAILNVTDDCAKNARSEKARPEWPEPILPNRRQLP